MCPADRPVSAHPYVRRVSTQPSPHDAVFRRILGDPANAASQLRAVLPADLTGRLDLRRLARVSDCLAFDSCWTT